MKILAIVQSPFRTLVEEQDDTILWLNQTLQKAGADISILLADHACSYAFQKGPLPLLQIGTWQQYAPASIQDDLNRLHAAGVPVYVIAEQLSARGLHAADLNPGVLVIPQTQLAGLYDSADQVWHW
jgi:hypothetical protein